MISEEFKYERDDKLCFPDDTIHVMLIPGHYDLLYKKKDFLKYDDCYKNYFKAMLY